ncbi:MAG: ABC transporter ATP-binding protein [Ilumatobacter sp.]
MEQVVPAVQVDRVGKQYLLGEREQYLALRDVIANATSRVIRRSKRDRDDVSRSQWALDDVSLAVAPGEVVGLLGRNGAGKSTLLKLISSITRPTRGSITVRGRVGTLLEVGSGFHPELTGAENIYLNGAILGMRRHEIRASYDDIVEFAGVAAHLDTPVKRYSTGMYMRLAFAVAAHLDTEVLLVDEVLAVGDAEFQRKCVGRMRELSQTKGRAVLFVSHNDAAIRQLCPRSVWLKNGLVHMDGGSDEVLTNYLDEQFKESLLSTWLDLDAASRTGSGEARFVQARIDVDDRPDARTASPGDPLTVRLRIEASEPVQCGNVALYLSTLGGTKVVSAGSGPADDVIELGAGVWEIEITIDALNLNPGRYTGSLWLARPTGARRKFGLYDHLEDVLDIVVAVPAETDPPEGLVVPRSSVRVVADAERP